ncbi:hypothetical protein [Sphingomonas albertensis]|uniref:Major facilitator superfamily (MFS) profile domain-containing protein n=1 Tax=Sphingomonas albertensis TaxID=2762591 RepID=A0ABR7AKZ3_9SPHN|nr:hypothetical protein [Sphingomonas albertensis]MBC3941141.1 hypothetical protein [Sphingomonas albertensis]
MIIALLLSIAAVLFLCWLLFTLASLALPFFAALLVGLWAHQAGAGIAGALVAGLSAGIATLVAGQLAFIFVRAAWVRVLIALIFAVPAAVAGYHAVHGLMAIGIASEGWRQTFGAVGAVVIGTSAWLRLAGGGGVGRRLEQSSQFQR